LLRHARHIVIEQRPRAESDIAVAAASIIAREAFINWLERKGKELDVRLERGVSAGVKETAKKLVKANGPEALRLLREKAAAGESFDLVIVDGKLAEMDALTLARQIKSDPALAAPKLVMLTSHKQRVSEQELKTAGFAVWLFRPYRASQLFNCLANALASANPASPGQDRHRADAQTMTPVQPDFRVLLAEDDKVNQLVALAQLNKLGYVSDVATNGFEVLAALKKSRYDVVLMDCQMPGLDGFATTQRIRHVEETQPDQTPLHIIAMTANAMTGDREKCLAAGMNDYVSKPVRTEELQAVLARVGREVANPGFVPSPV
jgi:CheY-like chemotaxis protein